MAFFTGISLVSAWAPLHFGSRPGILLPHSRECTLRRCLRRHTDHLEPQGGARVEAVLALRGGVRQHPYQDPDLPERSPPPENIPIEQNVTEDQRLGFWRKTLTDLKEAMLLTQPGDRNEDVEAIARSEDPMMALRNRGFAKATSPDDQWMVDMYNLIDKRMFTWASKQKRFNITRLFEMARSVAALATAEYSGYARPLDYWFEHDLMTRGQQSYFADRRRPRLKLNVAIVGGSLAGLITGLTLLKGGHKVWIFEQSFRGLYHQDDGRPVMIRPYVAEFLARHQVALPQELGVNLTGSRTYDDEDTRKFRIEGTPGGLIVSSYQLLLQCILKRIRKAYHYGFRVTSIGLADRDQAKASNPNATQHRGPYLNVKNRTTRFDLVVGADGPESLIRNTLEPQPFSQKEYEGYIAIHGTLRETNAPNQVLHMLSNGTRDIDYHPRGSRTRATVVMMPGHQNQIGPPMRRIAWTWYLNMTEDENAGDLHELFLDRRGRRHEWDVPQGGIRPIEVQKIHSRARAQLPQWLSDLIVQTPSPGASKVRFHLAHEAEFQGQVVLVGDAFAQVGPHTDMGPAAMVYQAEQLLYAISNSTSGDMLRKNLRLWSIKARQYIGKEGGFSRYMGHLSQQTDMVGRELPGAEPEAQNFMLDPDVQVEGRVGADMLSKLMIGFQNS